MNRCFGDDVGVKAVAKIDRIDIITVRPKTLALWTTALAVHTN